MQSQLMLFVLLYLFVYTVACMIPTPVTQFVDFSKLEIVIDNFNTLKINVKLKPQLTSHFQKIIYKLAMRILPILTLTTYTCKYMVIAL